MLERRPMNNDLSAGVMNSLAAGDLSMLIQLYSVFGAIELSWLFRSRSSTRARSSKAATVSRRNLACRFVIHAWSLNSLGILFRVLGTNPAARAIRLMCRRGTGAMALHSAPAFAGDVCNNADLEGAYV